MPTQRTGAKKRRGRPPSGIPREEQYRRSKAKHRATVVTLLVELSPEEGNALVIAAEGTKGGKSGWVRGVIVQTLKCLKLL
jgi:hypothetical protein